METINLIPQEERVQQVKTKVVKLSTVLSLAILVLVVAVGGFFYYQSFTLKTKLKATDGSIANLRTEINKLASIEIEARNLYKKSTVLATLFESRIYYSAMLEELEKSIPQGVNIKSYGLMKDKQVSIAGRADTYNQVQEFSNKLLERPLFTEISLNSVGLDNNKEGINFFIFVTYNEDLLHE